MACVDSRTGTYVLPLAKLTVQQLSNKAFEAGLVDVGERIQGILKPDQRRALNDKQGLKKVVASTSGSRSRRKKQKHATPIPTRCEIKTGWGTLLSEVTSSDKRVRVAKGGHFGAKTSAAFSNVTERSPSKTAVVSSTVVDVGVEESATTMEPSNMKEEMEGPPLIANDLREAIASASDCDIAAEEEPASFAAAAIEELGTPQESVGSPPRSRAGTGVNESTGPATWESYRVDEKKVPDKVLASMWRRAVDPKHCIDEIEPLAKVPRMTVTRREVEQLPPVHDIQHWRAVKTKRRAARKAHEESEEYPSLSEMMRTIFGQQAPPRPRPRGRSANQKEKDNVSINSDRNKLSAGLGYTVNVNPQDESAEGELADLVANTTLDDAADIDREDESFRFSDDAPIFVGVMRKGRRGALDEGRPWDRINSIGLARPLIEKEESQIGDKQRLHNNSHLSRAYEASQKAQFDSASTDQLTAAASRVNEQCQRKVMRMHTQFVRKQAQLSARLTRRVQRLQMDFQETQDNKVGSILPSLVAWNGAKSSRGSSQCNGYLKKGSSDRSDTVLQYLQHHRHKAEQERQTHHCVYLQQVERFQGYLRLLADPNRNPDRGELYLSECFRHVLSAGLIIDNTYFIRCLRNLEVEDFEKTPTVNLLAACCVAFDVDLRKYWDHLRKRGVSYFTPRPQKTEARSWEDWAPWDGVRLDSVHPHFDIQDAANDGVQHCAEDPFPFAPILPVGTPSASELVSRSDGDCLKQILQMVTLDSVLERYQFHRREPSPQQPSRKDLEHCFDEDVTMNFEMTPTGSTSSIQDLSNWVGQPSPKNPRTPPADKLSMKPTPPTSAANTPRGRAGVRKGGLNTLQRTRGVAEPMADMPGAPDKDRNRTVTQVAMASITEQPFLE